MIRHYNGSMQLKAFRVIMQTVAEHGVAGLRRKRVSITLTKCYEQCSSRFLIVWQFAAVFVLFVERTVGHLIAGVDC